MFANDLITLLSISVDRHINVNRHYDFVFLLSPVACKCIRLFRPRYVCPWN